MRRSGGGVAGFLGLGTDSGETGYEGDEQGGVMNATRRPDRWVRTTCGYCAVGCGMLVGVRDNRAVSVMGDPDHPVNRGRLCPKGLSEHHTLAADGRLTTPMIRGAGGEQEPVSWDAAVGSMVVGFHRLLREHGPDAVAVLSTGQLVTEEFYALGKLARLGFGLRHYDGNTTLCMSSAVSGYKASFGSDGPPGSYDDLAAADCILLVGANIADNHPLLVPRVLENDEATLIVVDPRVTKTATVADIHLAVRPRTDIILLNGMLKLLIDEGLVDHDYVAAHTEEYAELAAHVAGYDLDRVASECGVDAAAVRAATLAFGRAERAFIGWTMGVNHSVQGTQTVTLLNTLCLITGNVGRAGSAPFSITGQCNAMGTREAGGTASLPGYRAWDSPTERAELAELWGIAPERIPAERGRAYPDIIEGVFDGTIKGLWIIATNPPVSFPNRGRLERALANLDLLVVQDGFETPTTALGHVVLPAAIWGEKDGTYTNAERRVSRVRKAVDPPGEARSDFDIFLTVADALGVRDDIYPGWKTPEDAFTEWAQVSAGRLCDYSGITWDRIDAVGGVQWPCTPDTVDPAGSPRLYTDGVFTTPSGKAKLLCVTAEPYSDAPNDQYPFVLNTGRTVEHWHTRTKTGRVDVLEQLAPEGWVEVNPADATRLGVGPGDRVRMTSRRGLVDGVAVRVTATVREGEVFMPFHYDELCVNRLTIDEFDPVSREPNYKQSAVHLERR
ncbi:MAG: molybdopterin-dependent oxidoreductase [Acidimicrobiia bacterium]|nr:molybdopterin-dependent oxidoreductase [Acidimicrobiia bacterium]